MVIDFRMNKTLTVQVYHLLHSKTVPRLITTSSRELKEWLADIANPAVQLRHATTSGQN